MGKPRQGPIFEHRQTCRLRYRKRPKKSQKMGAEVFTNDLHDALMMKNNTAFWNCWGSKLETVSKCTQVNGITDHCINNNNNNNNNNEALSNSWTNRNCVHSDKKYIDKR